MSVRINIRGILTMLTAIAVIGAVGCSSTTSKDASKETDMGESQYEVTKSEEEWKKELTPEEYKVLREKGTERPFDNKYYKNKETGMYLCGACGNELFSSDTKYESGSGWPSFYQPADSSAIEEHDDSSLGMNRTEVVCSRCGSHLGHVFEDGPQPTGLRYCINSVALEFKQKDSQTDSAGQPEDNTARSDQ